MIWLTIIFILLLIVEYLVITMHYRRQACIEQLNREYGPVLDILENEIMQAKIDRGLIDSTGNPWISQEVYDSKMEAIGKELEKIRTEYEKRMKEWDWDCMTIK